MFLLQLKSTVRRSLLAALLCATFASTACAPALPRVGEGTPVQAVVEDTSALDARKSAADALKALERSEALLAEARALVIEAKESESRCRELSKKVPKVRRQIAAPVNTAVIPTPHDTAGHGVGKEPEYSPSDAPRPTH